ncbi:helicase-associated domain-containing protein [Parafrankia discariae]|uniref:helicase-associated domain-containing protein n=1 Tax=Parafrankia discariae TaxID=365528 RepID=UPI000366DA31|nr:helicase-associated domain-containing protein [Parafrankia discariae]
MAERRAAALREPRGSADSYLDFLQGLDEAALTAVLRARPDVLEDPPRGVGELVRRLGDAASMLIALNDLDRDGLLLCDAVMTLGPPVPLDRLVALLGGSGDGIRAALRPISRRALLWENDGVVHAFEPFRRLWDDEIAVWRPAAELITAASVADLRRAARGLVPGARITSSTTRERAARVVGQLMADPGGVATAVRRLPPAARDLLAALVRDPIGLVTGDRPEDLDDPDSLDGEVDEVPEEAAVGVLVESGLFLPVGGELEVPREVVAVLWAADPQVRLTGPPSLRPADTDRADEAFAAGIQAAAGHALRSVSALLAEAERTPLVALKKGGIGTRERARLARTLSLPEDELPLWIDVAHAAGLLAHEDGGYAPTGEYPGWRGSDVGRRWAVLALAWFLLDQSPTHREIDSGRDQPPPLPLASGAGRVRRTLLTTAGPGRSLAATGRHLEWFLPLHGYDRPQLANKRRAAVREAELLGVAAGDTVSDLGVALCEVTAAAPVDPTGQMRAHQFGFPTPTLTGFVTGTLGPLVDELAGRCGPALPRDASTMILQSDLTATVAGQPNHAIARLLADAAVSESRGTAGTWRFTPASVRGALDVGWSERELLDELRAGAAYGVPQGLEYLVADVARRHGHIRARAVRATVVADEATISEILATRALRSLGLRRLAPTVAACGTDAREVAERLRAAGMAPVVEDEHGTVVLHRRPGGPATALAGGAAGNGGGVGNGAGNRAGVGNRGGAGDRGGDGGWVAPVDVARRILANRSGAGDASRADPRVVRQLGRLNPRLTLAERQLLAAALDHGEIVTIIYRDRFERRTSRPIAPVELLGGRLDSWCHLREAQREFNVARIEGVAPG